MNPRRLAFWMLVTAGVAVGHIAGYAVAHPNAATREAALGGHAYLPATASVIIPVGVIAALAWGISSARALGLAGSIRWTHLATAQIGVFALQEVTERLLTGDGVGAVVAEHGVWFGLVAQVVVAVVVTRLVDLVRTVVRAVVGGAPRRAGVSPRLRTSRLPLVAPLPFCAVVAVGLRAPPVVGSPT